MSTGNDFSVGSLEGLNGLEYHGPVGRRYALGQAAASRFENDFVRTLARMLQFVKPGGSIPVGLTSVPTGPLKPKITVFPPPSGDLNSPLQRFIADLNVWQGTGAIANSTLSDGHYSNNEPYSWDPKNPDMNSKEKWYAYRAQQLYNIMSAIANPTPAEAVDLNYLIDDLEAYRPFLPGVYYATWKPATGLMSGWAPPSTSDGVPMFGSLRFLTAFGPLPSSIHPIVFASTVNNGHLISAYKPLIGAGKLFRAFNNYPWGGSAEWLKQAFVEVVGSDFIKNLAASIYPSGLDDYSIKDILGRVISDKWQQIVDNATSALDKENRKQQKRDLIRTVAMIAFGAITLPILGAAGAGLVNAGITLQTQRDRLDSAVNEARSASDSDAASLSADQQRAEDDIRKKLDEWYIQNVNALQGLGITADVWKSWSNTERIQHMTEIANGKFVPIAAPIPVVAPTTPVAPVPVVTAPVEQMPTIGPSTTQVPSLPPGFPPTDVAAGQVQMPPPIDQGPKAPAQAQYDLVVEGHVVGSYGTLDDVSKAAASLTSPGDRFEIMANGVSTGLRIRTATSAEEIPSNIADQVRAMPADQVKASVASATAPAASSGGFPWWILAIPAVAVVAAHK